MLSQLRQVVFQVFCMEWKRFDSYYHIAIESDNIIADVAWDLPAIYITDQPRFKWRGLMLDVSRHFFQKEYILKTIDRLAMFKEYSHFHLVD